MALSQSSTPESSASQRIASSSAKMSEQSYAANADLRQIKVTTAITQLAQATRLCPEQSLDYLPFHTGRLWPELARSVTDNILDALPDPKMPPPSDGSLPPLWIAADEDAARIREEIYHGLCRHHSADEARRLSNEVKILPLPANYQQMVALFNQPENMDLHGLLYLKEPYTVPSGHKRTKTVNPQTGQITEKIEAGRFNDMYGWDSALTIPGLLLDGQFAMAKSVVTNQAYQIMHYGGVDEKGGAIWSRTQCQSYFFHWSVTAAIIYLCRASCV